MRPEGIDKSKKKIGYLIGPRTRDLLACILPYAIRYSCTHQIQILRKEETSSGIIMKTSGQSSRDPGSIPGPTRFSEK
jgi:hypothetical protein